MRPDSAVGPAAHDEGGLMMRVVWNGWRALYLRMHAGGVEQPASRLVMDDATECEAFALCEQRSGPNLGKGVGGVGGEGEGEGEEQGEVKR